MRPNSATRGADGDVGIGIVNISGTTHSEISWRTAPADSAAHVCFNQISHALCKCAVAKLGELKRIALEYN
jgi:hypothetical protein